MARYVALLRGINVGGHRKVPMKDLRQIADELGFREASTYIQSGNLVFDAGGAGGGSERAAAKLAKAIDARFGFPVDVVVRTAAQWSRLASGNPFRAESAKEPNRVMALVSRDPPRRDAIVRLRERARNGERVGAGGGALWIRFPGGQGGSGLAPAFVDRCVGSPTTARNWTTVLALVARVQGESG